MRLVKKSDQSEVKVGDVIDSTDRGGRTAKYKILYMPKPHKPESEGKVECQNVFAAPMYSETYYASVWDLEWIEREDREPQAATTDDISDAERVQAFNNSVEPNDGEV